MTTFLARMRGGGTGQWGFNRERAVRFLLRGPGALESRIARWTVRVLTGIGGGFLVWSAAPSGPRSPAGC